MDSMLTPHQAVSLLRSALKDLLDATSAVQAQQVVAAREAGCRAYLNSVTADEQVMVIQMAQARVRAATASSYLKLLPPIVSYAQAIEVFGMALVGEVLQPRSHVSPLSH